MTKKQKTDIEEKIARIEAVWRSFGYPDLRPDQGWSQVEVIFNGPPSPLKAELIMAGFYYGQWRALQDLLGTKYGYGATLPKRSN